MSGLIGQVISERYRVDAFLGKGGMAEVYKVWDRNRSVHLAMKILHEDLAEDKIFLRRFRREAQTLSKLQHPNIVRFYGLGQDEDLFFMLMEYVEGTTLRKEIFKSDEPFSLKRVAQIIHPVCAALHYAHRSGFIHCDVKPANIMIHKNGTILVADFGIARMTEAATMTMVGAGTPAYMAPEQARGENPVLETDIYALGVVLFELLTGGERPFTGEHARTTGSTSEKIRWEQLNVQPPSPRKLNPRISPALSALILKCLSKDPKNRYNSALELLEDFEQSIIIAKEPRISSPKDRPEIIEDFLSESGPASDLAEGKPRKQEGLVSRLVTKLNILRVMFLKSFEPFNFLQPKSESTPESRARSAKRRVILPAFWRKNWIWMVFSAVTIGSLLYLSGILGLTAKQDPIDLKVGPLESSSAGLLYFTSNRDGKMEIYQLTKEPIVIRITHTKGDAESWSPVPDGRGNLYFISNRDGKTEIYQLTTEPKVVRITHTKGDAESWSPVPDGHGNLYFTSNRDGKMEIYQLTKEPKVIRITNTKGSAESWSPVPDGHGNLYFTSNRDGKMEIYQLTKEPKVIRITNTKVDAESWSILPDDHKSIISLSDEMGKLSFTSYLNTRGKRREIVEEYTQNPTIIMLVITARFEMPLIQVCNILG